MKKIFLQTFEAYSLTKLAGDIQVFVTNNDFTIVNISHSHYKAEEGSIISTAILMYTG